VSSTVTTAVTGATIGTAPTSTSAALGTLTCGATNGSVYLGGGTAQLQLQHVNTLSGTTVTSNVWTATCQGNAYTYTAGFDKTTYAPGTIATLTITFKDRDGDLANGYDVVGTTASLITIAGAPSATAVTIPADQDKATGGTGLALAGRVAVSATATVVNSSVDAATDAANEATDAANAATDAALAAADAADAATAAAQDASDAVAALSASVSKLISSLRAQITSLTNLVIKIQKKVRA
jgi:hypothetical protein